MADLALEFHEITLESVTQIIQIQPIKSSQQLKSV